MKDDQVPELAGDPMAAPVPERDVDSAPFWEGLDRHELRLQGCDDCTRLRFPAMPSCPYCASGGFHWRTLTGHGSIYSWIVVRQAFWPSFAGQVPYALATIDLDEGARVVARMDDLGLPDFGVRVAPAYVDHEAWTELRFTEEDS